MPRTLTGLMAKGRKKAPKSKLDLLSNLPNDILENILGCLPIKEAVRTSILSTKWRYRAAMLQTLKFDEKCISTQNRTTFAHIVDQILLHHIGPIHEFVLSHEHLSATADVDRWILHLSRSSIKHLTLDMFTVHRYKLPSCFFSCQDIIYLQLDNCNLKPPSTFRGFQSLEHLNIQNVTLTQHVFEDFIVRCPMLKELILIDCDGFKNVCINAPNLRLLYLEGEFEDVVVQNTLNLATVSMCLTLNVKWVVGSVANLLKFLAQLPNLRDLEIAGYSLKYLAAGPSLIKLLQPLLFLNDLFVDINLTYLEETVTALCLLRSSPSLLSLQIWVNHDDDRVVGEANSGFENSGDHSDCQLTELRRIEIRNVRGDEAELDLIKFLLSSSPVLEYMTLTLAADVVGSLECSLKMLKEAIRYRRASAQAEIVLLDP